VVVTKLIAASDNANMIEAIVIQAVVRWIEEHQLRSVVVESNSKYVVDMINNHKLNRAYQGRIAHNCLHMMKRLYKVSMV